MICIILFVLFIWWNFGNVYLVEFVIKYEIILIIFKILKGMLRYILEKRREKKIVMFKNGLFLVLYFRYIEGWRRVLLKFVVFVFLIL